jgi:hypothetical protein
MKPYQTTRIWKETVKKLKLISALTGTSMVATIDRLASEELKKLKNAMDKESG